MTQFARREWGDARLHCAPLWKATMTRSLAALRASLLTLTLTVFATLAAAETAAHEQLTRIAHAYIDAIAADDPIAATALGLPAEALALAKDLKRRGWTFVGPTTVYAFMQAMGLVDDHFEGCAVRPRAEAARTERAITPPAPRERRRAILVPR